MAINRIAAGKDAIVRRVPRSRPKAREALLAVFLYAFMLQCMSPLLGDVTLDIPSLMI